MTEIEQLKKDLSHYSVVAYNRILASSAGGNNSVRLGDSEEFLITASGLSLGDTKPENIITINAEGEKINGPEGLKPSKESRMHAAIYVLRPDVKAIFHVHPRYCIALSILGESIPPVTVSAQVKLGEIPLLPESMPGSDELLRDVRNIIPTLDDSVHTLLLARHGIISIGSSITEAYIRADLAEETAHIAYLTKIATR
ncbi:class II aldolase/adducin family protein [bacterium]|nr:class II aldolase/adducin family protein [bacterium]